MSDDDDDDEDAGDDDDDEDNDDFSSPPTCIDLLGLAWTCLAKLPLAYVPRFPVAAHLPRLS
eukprot:10259834-Karenia_brevis.AAC.1